LSALHGTAEYTRPFALHISLAKTKKAISHRNAVAHDLECRAYANHLVRSDCLSARDRAQFHELPGFTMAMAIRRAVLARKLSPEK
jgi:hypothetical protein